MSLHIDGFDQFRDDPSTAAALTRAGYIVSGTASISLDPLTETARVIVGSGYISREHAWVDQVLTAGINSNFTERGSQLFIEFADASRVICWTNPETGAPNLNNVIGGSLPIRDTPYFYEIELSRVDSTARLYINGRYELALALTPAQVASTTLTVSFGILPPSDYNPSNPSAQTGSRQYHDYYVYDGGRLGPIRITTRFPTYDLVNDWLMAGGTTAWEILGTLPPEPLDRFIASENIGDEAIMGSDKELPTDNAIVGTGMVVLARKSPDFDAALQVFVGDGIDTVQRVRDLTVEGDWELQYVAFNQIVGDTKPNIQMAPMGLRIINSP